MTNLIKEIDKKDQMRTKRLIQCHEDCKTMWQYYNKERNPCECGSNCFHYEYDRINNVIYGVCNCCNTDIYVVKDEYFEEKLHTGEWLGDEEITF